MLDYWQHLLWYCQAMCLVTRHYVCQFQWECQFVKPLIVDCSSCMLILWNVNFIVCTCYCHLDWIDLIVIITAYIVHYTNQTICCTNVEVDVLSAKLLDEGADVDFDKAVKSRSDGIVIEWLWPWTPCSSLHASFNSVNCLYSAFQKSQQCITISWPAAWQSREQE